MTLTDENGVLGQRKSRIFNSFTTNLMKVRVILNKSFRGEMPTSA